MPQQVRLAPLLIHAGAGTGGSDVLAVATGSSGLGETPQTVLPGSATIDELRLPSTVGLRANDLVLVAEAGVGCMVQQVGVPATPYGASQLLSFAGTYAKADIDSLQLVNLGAAGSANVTLLGNTTGNLPMLQLFGVGADNTLFSYDLLQLDGGGNVQPIANGVSDMRALYGVDTTGDGLIDSWIAPTAVGYTAATLGDGSAASQHPPDDHHGGARGHGPAFGPHRARGRRAGHDHAVRRPASGGAAHPQHRGGRSPPTRTERRVHGAAAQRDARGPLMKPKSRKLPRHLAGARAQRGVVLLFAMIALVILLIGTAALMRSMNTSLFTAGNFAFKRDLTNQGERAMATVLDLVQTGALVNEATREGNSAANNYSATLLPSNDQGLPLALLSDAAFAGVGVAGNDIAPAGMGVRVRYLVDRMCAVAGALDAANCTLINAEVAGVSSSLAPPDPPPVAVYRVTIRVDGPRGTQSFFQSTFSI